MGFKFVKDIKLNNPSTGGGVLSSIDFLASTANIKGSSVNFATFLTAMTTSAVGVRNYIDDDGSLKSAADGALRRSTSGALCVDLDSENFISNPSFAGAAAGVMVNNAGPGGAAGTLPTGMAFNGAFGSGVSFYIDDLTPKNGFPGLGIGVRGTLAAAGSCNVQFATNILLALNEIWSWSVYIEQVRVTGLSSMRLAAIESSTVSAINNHYKDVVAGASPMQRVGYQHLVETANANAPYARPRLTFNLGAGTIDIYVRLYAPQFEKRNRFTAPMVNGYVNGNGRPQRTEAFTLPSHSSPTKDVLFYLSNGYICQQDGLDLSAGALLPQHIWQGDRISKIEVAWPQYNRKYDTVDGRSAIVQNRVMNSTTLAQVDMTELFPYPKFMFVTDKAALGGSGSIATGVSTNIRKSISHVDRWDFSAPYDQRPTFSDALKLELQTPSGVFPSFPGALPRNADVWIAYSVMFPPRALPLKADSAIFGQMHATEDGASTAPGRPVDATWYPNLAFRLGSPQDQYGATIQDHMYLYTAADPNITQQSAGLIANTYDLLNAVIQRGVWYNIVFRVVFGWSNDAQVQVWVNGTQVLSLTGTNIGYNDIVGPAWNYGLYVFGNYDTLAVEVSYANMELRVPSIQGSDLSARITRPLPI